MSAMKKEVPQKSAPVAPGKSMAYAEESALAKYRKPASAVVSYAEDASSKQKTGKHPKTKVVAHFDCGFSNNLFIRGEGISSLSWDKGIQMKNVGPNRWVWESDRPFSTAQFKVLVNDASFEQGNNHTVAFGQEIDFTPQF